MREETKATENNERLSLKAQLEEYKGKLERAETELTQVSLTSPIVNV